MFLVVKKKHKEPVADPPNLVGLGIPGFDRAEKLTEVIPVKVQPSLKEAIPNPHSTWIRDAIIEKLDRLRMEEENFEE